MCVMMVRIRAGLGHGGDFDKNRFLRHANSPVLVDFELPSQDWLRTVAQSATVQITVGMVSPG